MGWFDIIFRYDNRSDLQMLKFISGGCINVLATMEDCSIDMILTSPHMMTYVHIMVIHLILKI